MTVDFSKNIILINDQLYYIEIWLYNQIDRFPPIQIPFTVIENLVIEETLNDWNTKGYITINNDFEFLERGDPGNDTGNKNSVNYPSPYLFRSDGRNKLSIKIHPVTKQIGLPKGFTLPKNFTSSIVSDLPEEYWNMNFDFIIYDIEDFSTGNPQNKIRKYYFHDERFQILLERNIEWSTSSNEYQTKDITAKDEERALNTSLAIKSILKTASSNQSDPKYPNLNVGNKSEPSKLDNPDIPLYNIDETKWDAGDVNSTVLYTSPANSNALLDLDYVQKYAVSKDGSPLFLLFGRYDRKWSLVSLQDIIKKAEENQIERIILVDRIDPISQKPYIPRAPIDINSVSNIKNFQSAVASKILDYKFVPMVPNDDMELSTMPLHNYDFSDSSFNVYYNGNKITDLLDNFKKVTSQGLYAMKNKGQLLMHINQTKKNGLLLKNDYTPRKFFPKNASYLNMAKKLLLLNQALFFSTVGLTFRSPGKFIFVDRDSSTGDVNVFDDRFLGQWLVSKVSHIFTKNSYKNEVYANKVDIFNAWFDEIDNKY